MHDPIGITPAELCQIILACCGAIITVSGSITVIINAVKKAKAPNKKQDERLDALEVNVRNIEEKLQSNNIRFQSDTERMESIERSMSETNKIIIEGLQALTSHAIDGNNIEALKSAKKSLDGYLINKV